MKREATVVAQEGHGRGVGKQIGEGLRGLIGIALDELSERGEQRSEPDKSRPRPPREVAPRSTGFWALIDPHMEG